VGAAVVVAGVVDSVEVLDLFAMDAGDGALSSDAHAGAPTSRTTTQALPMTWR
jgi:hypothetical protein